jgi:hypothetical protein
MLREIGIKDIDILKVGHDIQLYGAVYSDKGRLYVIPMPDEDPQDLRDVHSDMIFAGKQAMLLRLSADELNTFFRQTDVLDVQGPDKTVLRKSQRQIDQSISWNVYRRDSYTCRYCGRDDVPLTVDHVDLWEVGGQSVEENLITACRRCNKLRGSMPYEKWITSVEYMRVSKELPSAITRLNMAKVDQLPYLESVRGKVRGR